MLEQFKRSDVDDTVAEELVRIRAGLCIAGNLIADIDSMIAAIAMTCGLSLLTGNHRHLSRIEGLELVDP